MPKMPAKMSLPNLVKKCLSKTKFGKKLPFKNQIWVEGLKYAKQCWVTHNFAHQYSLWKKSRLETSLELLYKILKNNLELLFKIKKNERKEMNLGLLESHFLITLDDIGMHALSIYLSSILSI